jgi:hypothetical protein
MAANFVWTFTTGAAPDLIPPTVISTNPLNLAINVPLNQLVTAAADNPLFHKGTFGQPTSRDQRRFRRFGVKLPCRIKPRAARKSAIYPELEAETLDVSRGGLFFLASAGLAMGTAIEVELDLPAHVVRRPVKIRCRGTITRVVPQEEGRIGIGATIDYYRISPSTAQVR